MLLLAPMTAAQDDKPTIGILSMASEYYEFHYSAILDMLGGYGLINEEERAALNNREDIQGEHLNIFWGIAELGDVADASLALEAALDKDPDAIITLSAIVTQLASNLTRDLPDPPIVLFTAVSDPYSAGLAQASCLKPAHVTGTQSVQNFEIVVDALLTQNPDLQTIGVIHASGDANSESAAAAAALAAQARGVNVESAAVVGVSDLAFATDGLATRGVDAIILATSILISGGTGIVVETASDAGLPVSTASMGSIYTGATIAVGNYRTNEEGYSVTRILIGWLNGEVDIAQTGIDAITDVALGLNLSSASLAQIAVTDALLAEADGVIDGDMYRMSPRMVRDQMPQFAEFSDEMILMVVQAADIPGVEIADGKIVMPLAGVIGEATGFAASNYVADPEADAAIIASLQCTDEMIAQQQAELDSA